MQDYTLKIKENSSKSSALLEYLRTLDFIEIKKKKDWWDNLSPEEIQSIEKGIEDLNNGKIHSDKSVRDSIHQRILAKGE